MPRPIRSVLTAMTPFPYAVQADESVAVARAMMQEHGIHHLPVMRDGALVGIVSARDIGVATDVLGGRESAVPLLVWSVCTRDPFVVEVDARLDQVADRLADLHIGSALVTKHGKLAGIVTVTDLCRALGSLLRAHGERDDDPDDVA
ncbi:MAG: CBS domain-containing protein [Deltaproteobacteria bacterium]|nr:CBS domain-containing protein [Deltaproteobacteria bacterium]MBK8238824.1 CBS domain-containing protein [Deltaproteobacteria bacterium]MBK8715707.1 CBS domain-containing protein [Deltaproteobacteria bacterium]MBP7292239.1 CBS domain-containing protein [Nannocystaceae bacterium]